jgi:hypothetical protein
MSFTARRLLTSVAALAVAILALRSSLGPFHLWEIGTAVNSPFGAENIFWLAILGLLCLLPQTTATPQSGPFPRLHLVLALCLIALAFARNLSDPFLSDDYIILSGPPFHWNAFFAALHRPGGDGAFRPLGAVYYQVVESFAGMNPVIWHSLGLALHLANAAFVFHIAWKLWRDPTAATVATLIFGLHGTRPEAALWTAGNFDLLASACVLGSIVLALHRHFGKSLALVAIGILFKESAYATPLVAFFILWPARPFRSFRLYLVASLGICAALFAWRWHLFHGPGGYIDPTTGQPAVLSLHPLTAAKGLFLRIWDVLLVPVNWDAPESWWLPFALTASLLGILYLAAGGRKKQLCLIPATCCAVLPAIHLALIGQSELGSRILYLAAAPFALLLGSLAIAADKRTLIVCAIMLAGMTGILEHNLNAWHRAALQAQKLCRSQAPPESAPGTFEGVFLFQNGFPQCVAAARNPE